MSALRFRLIVVVASVSMLVPMPGFTEQVATTFQQLQKQIQNGQPVVVTDSNGVQVKGKVEEASESRIALSTSDGRREFWEAQVLEIRKQADSVVNGTVLGAIIGVGAGLAVGAAIDASRGEGTWLLPAIAAGGAGGGALAGFIGDATRPHADLLFKRSASGAAALRLTPLVSPTRVELQGAVRF